MIVLVKRLKEITAFLTLESWFMPASFWGAYSFGKKDFPLANEEPILSLSASKSITSLLVR